MIDAGLANNEPALIVLAGLPGTGKSTIARELARRLAAVHVRIDSIEQAIRESGLRAAPLDDVGYRVGYAVAEDNLRLGRSVIADSVNPLRLTREAWAAVAQRAGVRCVDVEVTCSNPDEHRQRVERRTADIAGFELPSWQDVAARKYESWDRDRIVIDTAGGSAEIAVAAILHRLASRDH